MSRADYVLVSVAVLCLVVVGLTVRPFANYGGVLGIIGVVIGVALGLFGDRWLRYRGDVHCQVQGLGAASHRQGTSGPAPFKVDQSAQIHFFNEKEVDTGLSQLAVVFVYEDAEVVLGPKARNYETSTTPRGAINLPSRTWVSVDIRGSFYGPEARLLEEGTRKAIEIDGKFPGGTPYHKRCSEVP
jgi:hypothetical protein